MRFALACAALAATLALLPSGAATDDCVGGSTGLGDGGDYLVCVLDDHSDPYPGGNFAYDWPFLLNFTQTASVGGNHVEAGGETGAAQYVTNACATTCFNVDSEGAYTNGHVATDAAGGHSLAYGAGTAQTIRQTIAGTTQRTGAGAAVAVDGQGTGAGFSQFATSDACTDTLTVTVLGSATPTSRPCTVVLPDYPGFPDLDGPGQ